MKNPEKARVTMSGSGVALGEVIREGLSEEVSRQLRVDNRESQGCKEPRKEHSRPFHPGRRKGRQGQIRKLCAPG